MHTKQKPKPENPQAMTPPSPNADFATPIDRQLPQLPQLPQSPQVLPQLQLLPSKVSSQRSPTTSQTQAQLDAINMITKYDHKLYRRHCP